MIRAAGRLSRARGRLLDGGPPPVGVSLSTAMNSWTRLVRFVVDMVSRRRNRWIEVSVTRAWSHDMPPRLFDLGD